MTYITTDPRLPEIMRTMRWRARPERLALVGIDSREQPVVLRLVAGLTGRLRLGVTYTVAGYFMARHYAAFRRSYPGVTLDLSEQPRAAIETALVSGGLDLAVMLTSNLGNAEELEAETLFRSRRRLWLPSDHPLLAAAEVSLHDVAREPYIMLTVDEASRTAGRYWEAHRLTPEVVFTTSSVEAVRSMVAAGMGVIVYPEGTRMAPGQTRKYGIGGALLACETGAPVVPIAHNSGYFWRRRSLLKKAGTIRVVIGPPIDPAGLTPREVNERAQQWIEAKVAEIVAQPGGQPR